MTTLLGRGTAQKIKVKLAANTSVKKGEYLVSPPDGYVKPGYEAPNLVIVGRADFTVSNNPGLAGAKSVVVETVREINLSLFTNDSSAPVTQDNVFGLVYLKNSTTVSASSASDTRTSLRCWEIDENGLIACEVL